MVCEQGNEVFPQSSVATQVRVLLYSCGQVPGAVSVETMLMVGVPSQASVALGVPKEGALGHSMVAFAGQVMVGGTLSST